MVIYATITIKKNFICEIEKLKRDISATDVVEKLFINQLLQHLVCPSKLNFMPIIFEI